MLPGREAMARDGEAVWGRGGVLGEGVLEEEKEREAVGWVVGG